MDASPLGFLFRCDSKGNHTEAPLRIYKDEDLLIGRQSNCDYQILDGHVSSTHLRIYTIIYDENETDDIPPLVFAQNLSRFGTEWNNYPVKEPYESFLISHGDILRLSPATCFVFESVFPTPKDLFSQQQHRETQLFAREYIISRRVLGNGSFGRVHMAFRASDVQQLACKLVALCQAGVAVTASDAAAVANAKIESYEREAKLIAGLKHPNIITFEKAFRCDDTIYIFSELATAGDLYSFMKYKGGTVEPTTVIWITMQLLQGLQYLHEHNIVHRDIKPDNILVTSREDGGRVMLTDFGSAKMMEGGVRRLSSIVGTLEYCAPEMLTTEKMGYTDAVDMWSLGRVIACMLVGWTLPRNPTTEFAEKLDLVEEKLAAMGLDAHPMDLLCGLLDFDETRRLDAKTALRHSWFLSVTNKSELELRYQQFIQIWTSKSQRVGAVEPITRLTVAHPFAYSQQRHRPHSTVQTENFTLFPAVALASVQPLPLALERVPGWGLEFVSQVQRPHADTQLPKGKYLYIAPEEADDDF